MKTKIFILCLLLGTSLTLQAKKTIKVACVGNSITQGAAIYNQQRDSYPGLLGQMLGAGYEVRNYGFSGRPLLNKGDRPYMKEQMFLDALAFEPDIVTIKLGTNDTKPFNWVHHHEFMRDLEQMVNAFSRLSSKPQIWLCYPVPAFHYDWGINDTIVRDQVIPYIRKVAQKHDLNIIDLYTPFIGKGHLFADGIHPNEEGALVLAKEVYRALKGEEVPAGYRPQAYPGVRSDWQGYERYNFNFKEKQATLVVPKQAAEGKPWIWRPAFFGAFPSVDLALLEKGYHVVYFELDNEFANPASLKAGDDFYKYMVKFYALSPRVVLEGFSRGGLYAFNWALSYPQKVACLYLDAPVCDVYSWPGRERPEWQDFLKKWQLGEDQLEQFTANPVDNTEALVATQIPLILVAGTKDKLVPYKHNGAHLYQAYKKAGLEVKQILKKGVGHHPHSLEDPAEIVEFILEHNK